MKIIEILHKGDKPTPEQLKQIEKAARMPITFDEDSPRMDKAMEKAFREAAIKRGKIDTNVQE